MFKDQNLGSKESGPWAHFNNRHTIMLSTNFIAYVAECSFFHKFIVNT